MGFLNEGVAVITGAGSGMGRTTALIFAQEGAKVAAVDINEAQVKEVAAEVASKWQLARAKIRTIKATARWLFLFR